MVQLSRRIAAFLLASPHYELLPDEDAALDGVFMIVLFRAKDRAMSNELVGKINETRQMYVSGNGVEGRERGSDSSVPTGG